MQPKDYTICAIILDLNVARSQGKVKLMEETQRVLTSDFLRSNQKLKKREDEHKNVKERLDVLQKKEKAHKRKIAHLA